ncbi:hypothetical protein HCW_08595 [Helicobacter cetorum MIT 00-7128]|uniref:phosphoglycolate phosphatase n=2 Tax=Helicobacter cetorum TaxID=138563 RepID=I0EPV5_HELC0|nr:hypothetical protein HCW_08595 [Helicobacter cetorum MIT 00-7128]
MTERNMALEVVLWDFDGVIFDSMHLKCEGLKALFRTHGNNDEEILKEFEIYHYKSGGISRSEKIKYFYNEILRTSITQEEIDKLALEFGAIVEQKLFDRAHLNNEVMAFIDKNYQNYTFHIASAALHSELQVLCEFLGITKYFKSIEGSPPSKPKIIANIIQKYSYQPSNMLMIGDSKNDYESAMANEVAFLGYNSEVLKSLVRQEGYKGKYVESFKGFDLREL